METKELAKHKIAKLAQKWRDINFLESGIKRENFSETDTATKFIRPLLEALGWDTVNIDEVREEVSTDSGLVADCVLYVNNRPYAVIEYKKLVSGSVEKDDAFARIMEVASQLGVKYAIFTRFSETKVYDVGDEFEVASFEIGGESEYETKFEKLWRLLSKNSAMHVPRRRNTTKT